ncbi:tetratricopeptide repeat protein [Bacteroides sp. 519]|uniref:tetratricopeptide repeat protein n=1 Tax=Bacteroides sp. 519 TaxID=2302937 RepID=UPI0013D8C23F|nr:tetratricopeptide repeat protein [Bacteroides sp. 519]NDV59970.1 tetratricopeptide repeat protein [Bacteroides sp. 519]
MLRKRYIILTSFLLVFAGLSAQKAERDNIRKGNRAYRDSLFINAEVNYRKALEENPGSAVSMYNLGNTLINQQKYQEAMEQYQMAAKVEKDKMKLSQIYHNSGVLLQASKDYAKAIEAYKQSLRNNPKDDETRYNLALCQKLLEDQEQKEDQNDDNQENQDNQDQQDQQEKQDQDKQDQQNKDQQDQQQQDQQQQDQQQQDSQQQEQKENEMSKENAEQMLNSVMQDEKDVQEKVQKQQQILQGGKLEKNW